MVMSPSEFGLDSLTNAQKRKRESNALETNNLKLQDDPARLNDKFEKVTTLLFEKIKVLELDIFSSRGISQSSSTALDPKPSKGK